MTIGAGVTRPPDGMPAGSEPIPCIPLPFIIPWPRIEPDLARCMCIAIASLSHMYLPRFVVPYIAMPDS